MVSLGQYLKREREYRAVSLGEMSQATRIPLPKLQALEEDDFENLPGVAITKGFLKAYVGHAGLDEQEVMYRYDAFLKEHNIDVRTSFNKLKPVMTRGRSAVLVTVLGVVILIVIFYLSMR